MSGCIPSKEALRFSETFISYCLWCFGFGRQVQTLTKTIINKKKCCSQPHGLEAFWVKTPVCLTATPRCRWEVPSSPFFFYYIAFCCLNLIHFQVWSSGKTSKLIFLPSFYLKSIINGGLFVLELNKHTTDVYDLSWLNKPAYPLVWVLKHIAGGRSTSIHDFNQFTKSNSYSREFHQADDLLQHSCFAKLKLRQTLIFLFAVGVLLYDFA